MLYDKSMRQKKDIIYPVFLECCQYAEDSFWECVFEDLAHGRSPYGTYISKDFLCCRYKGREFNYKIERKKPEKIYNDVYNLLTKKLGIFSHKEKVQKRIDFQNLEKSIRNKRQEWSKIRKKNIKDILYKNYALDMKIKHNLTTKQAKYLLSLIIMMMMFKTLTSKDIIYENDRIVDISGIEFKDGDIVVKRPIFGDHVTEPTTVKHSEKKLSDYWEKHLDIMRRNFGLK